MKKICKIALLVFAFCHLTAMTAIADESEVAKIGEPAKYETGEVKGEALARVSGEFQTARSRSRQAVPFKTEILFTRNESAQTFSRRSGSESSVWEIILVRSDSLGTEELIKTLEGHPGVEYAEPNYTIQMCDVNVPVDDPYFGRQWHLQNVGEAAGKIRTPWTGPVMEPMWPASSAAGEITVWASVV